MCGACFIRGSGQSIKVSGFESEAARALEVEALRILIQKLYALCCQLPNHPVRLYLNGELFLEALSEVEKR